MRIVQILPELNEGGEYFKFDVCSSKNILNLLYQSLLGNCNKQSKK